MAGTELVIPASMRPVWARRSLRGQARVFLGAFLIFAGVLFCAEQSHAQDVAEAARQERARKESQAKKSKHVYTNEDLKRDKILTPEDRAQVEAKKSQPGVPAVPQRQKTFDAGLLPPNAPLGDVARKFRAEKELKKLQEPGQFHIPASEAPAFASPKPPVEPLAPPVAKRAPRFAPYRPPMRRSPFERPRVFVLPPANMVPPRAPAAGMKPAQPTKPIEPGARSTSRVAAATVAVKRGDSLWKLAQEYLGQGLRWNEFLTVNPDISDPNHIRAGSRISLPAAASSVKAKSTYKVRKGDSLWKIARTQFGHGSAWTCIAQANPNLADANLLHGGQSLMVPASCAP